MSQRYKAHDRGNRLEPTVLSTRYHVLRQLADAMRELANDPRLGGELMVDFGSGSSPYAPLFAPKYARFVRADLPGNVDADIEIEDGRIPLGDGVANAVLSSQVLEHVVDPRLYLAEARRVLRHDGWLVISTHGTWKYHPDPGDYWRWTRDGLLRELEVAGFRTVSVRSVLGRGATAIQLVQDAIADSLPRILRPVPGLLLQRVVGALERRRDPQIVAPDAAVYVVLAGVAPLTSS